MKTKLNFAVATFLLFAASSQCFALRHIVDVSKDRAKELGVEIRSKMVPVTVADEKGSRTTYETKVWLELKTQGELKGFMHAELEVTAGEKRLVSATLQPSHPSADSVVVDFSTDPAYMPASIVTVVVRVSERTMVGYRFKMKDFIEPEKSR